MVASPFYIYFFQWDTNTSQWIYVSIGNEFGILKWKAKF